MSSRRRDDDDEYVEPTEVTQAAKRTRTLGPRPRELPPLPPARPQIDVLGTIQDLVPQKRAEAAFIHSRMAPQNSGVAQLDVRRIRFGRQVRRVVAAKARIWYGFGVGTTTVPHIAEEVSLPCDMRCECGNDIFRQYKLLWIVEALPLTEQEFAAFRFAPCECGDQPPTPAGARRRRTEAPSQPPPTPRSGKRKR